MDDLFESTVEILLDAAFDDARWGEAFRAIDRLCGLNGGQFTALAADGEPTFAACWIGGDPHQEIVADWIANYAALMRERAADQQAAGLAAHPQRGVVHPGREAELPDVQ